MNETNWFFDTSILLYLLSADDRKADTAEVLLQRSGNISSEDLQDRQVIDGTLTIVNPFNAPAPAA